MEISNATEALKILIQAVYIAQQKQIYSALESEMITKAIDFFVDKSENKNDDRQNE